MNGEMSEVRSFQMDNGAGIHLFEVHTQAD